MFHALHSPDPLLLPGAPQQQLQSPLTSLATRIPSSTTCSQIHLACLQVPKRASHSRGRNSRLDHFSPMQVREYSFRALGSGPPLRGGEREKGMSWWKYWHAGGCCVRRCGMSSCDSGEGEGRKVGNFSPHFFSFGRLGWLMYL